MASPVESVCVRWLPGNVSSDCPAALGSRVACVCSSVVSAALSTSVPAVTLVGCLWRVPLSACAAACLGAPPSHDRFP